MSGVRKDKNRENNRRKPLSDEELSNLFGQLSMLLGAGISAPDALEIMRGDEENGDPEPVLTDLKEQIEAGASLSSAAKGCGQFPSYAVSLLRIGEETGQTDRICGMLARYYEEQADLRSSVRDAFFYPFVMILMMFVLIIVLLTQVMPLFGQVFTQLGASVSGIALVLMNISTALSRGYTILIAAALLLCAIFIYFMETVRGRQQLHTLMQRCPLTGNFSRRLAAARFASSLQITLSSGMDMPTALTLCRSLAENDALEAQIDTCIAHVREGGSLAEALSGAGIFSSFYSGMIRAADRTGEVDRVLGYVAEHYKEETDAQIDRMLARIEPALVAVCAVFVGIILLSVILPLMGAMTSIG